MSEMYLEIDTDDEAEWEQAMKEVCSHQADLVLAVLACTQCRLSWESRPLTANEEKLIDIRAQIEQLSRYNPMDMKEDGDPQMVRRALPPA